MVMLKANWIITVTLLFADVHEQSDNKRGVRGQSERCNQVLFILISHLVFHKINHIIIQYTDKEMSYIINHIFLTQGLLRARKSSTLASGLRPKLSFSNQVPNRVLCLFVFSFLRKSAKRSHNGCHHQVVRT